jgi:hypothetical protein
MKQKRWTEQDISRLQALIGQGASATRCAAALDRPLVSVRKLARRLGCELPSISEVRADIRKKISAAEAGMGPGGQRNDGSFA